MASIATSKLLLLIFCYVICFVSSSSSSSSSADISGTSSPSKVSLGLYYESLCPYCSSFIVNHLTKLFEDDLISIVDLHLSPWGNTKLRSDNVTAVCQHGAFECLLDTVEACAIDAWPKLGDHFPFIHCVESLVTEHKYDKWETCYQKLNLNSKPVSDCLSSGHGDKLELQYAAETSALQPPHQYVPWVVVDGQPLPLHLSALMLKMGFDERLVDLIMCCVTSVTYQVLVNGQPRGRILPRRGLRQGDPLSPFLFILCTEALISLLNGAEAEKKILGLRVARTSPRISHLLFADDSLFFCKAELSQCKEIIDILDIYGKASGQRLNASKSSMFFGNRVESSRKQDIKDVLGFSTEGGMGMYLGLPEQIGGSKMKVFSFVQDRYNGRVNTWSSRLLSKGGKEVQIKYVAQAIPTFVMSCYLLPQGITDKLRSTTSNFWWSSKQNSRGLHWIAWDEICTPKDLGGLGFRDLHDFNIALLAKQLWRLIQYPNSLIARVLKGRYYNHTSSLEDRRIYSPSYGWRSIMAAKPLLISGLRKTIGTGQDTRVWSESWVPDAVARPPRPADHIVYRLPQLLVQSFIRNDTKEWDIQLLHEFFHPDDIPLILGLKISCSCVPDGYVWNHTKSGVYSVKTGYDLLRSTKLSLSQKGVREPSITSLQSHVWKIKAPSKMKHFLWQAISGCVATAERLMYRHLATNRSCPRCAGPVESINHLLFECPPALQVWALSDYPSLPGYFPSTSIYQNMNFLFWKRKEVAPLRPQFDTFPWIFWYIWKARNDKLFNGKDVSPIDTLQHASLEAECWRKANEKEEANEDPDDSPTTEAEVVSPWNLRIPTCQIDASWINNGSVSGLGWSLKDQLGTKYFGLRACNRSLSALHAEMEGLLWAVSCMRDKRITSVRFETDCSDLVDMTTNPMDWPSFATEIEMFQRLKKDFEDVSLSHIPRSRNGRADALAKEARSRGYIFSHMDQTRTDGDALRRIGSSVLHLI